jgi:hypothetical protein
MFGRKTWREVMEKDASLGFKIRANGFRLYEYMRRR